MARRAPSRRAAAPRVVPDDLSPGVHTYRDLECKIPSFCDEYEEDLTHPAELRELALLRARALRIRLAEEHLPRASQQSEDAWAEYDHMRTALKGRFW